MTDQDDGHEPVAVISLADVREEALTLLAPVPEGDGLGAVEVALIRLAVRASVTVLDRSGMEHGIRAALDVGATSEQVHETLVVVSGLGVHTLMEGSALVTRVLRERGDGPGGPLDSDRSALRDRYQGNDPYWADFEREVPGFLDSLLRHCPEAYEAFFTYCAVPWRTGAVRGRVKELMSMAGDATPSHRYLPGMRLHLANAVRRGAGRTAILHALDLAAEAPAHPGVAPHSRWSPEMIMKT